MAALAAVSDRVALAAVSVDPEAHEAVEARAVEAALHAAAVPDADTDSEFHICSLTALPPDSVLERISEQSA